MSCRSPYDCDCSCCVVYGPGSRIPDGPPKDLIEKIKNIRFVEGLPNVIRNGEHLICLECGSKRLERAPLDNSLCKPGYKRCTCGCWVKEKNHFSEIGSFLLKPLTDEEVNEPKGEKSFDEVEKPYHYSQGEVECIDAIASALGPKGFKYYCQGVVIKYIWRYTYKGKPLQDLKKARWYLDKLMSVVKGEE